MSARHHRLDVKRWRRVRFAVLDRDGWRCRKCRKAGRLEVDHIVPLEQGGAPFDRSNLQTLCRGCHIAKSRGERDTRRPERRAWDKLIADRLGSA